VLYWQQSSQGFDKRAFELTLLLGGAMVAAVTALTVVFGSDLVVDANANAPAALVAIDPRTPPAAEQVERDLVGLTNAHSLAIGSAARIGHASCVSGGPGSYACSYVRIVPPGSGVCAVALLRWTPNKASTYTVTTAGRVALPANECGPVTKVLHVLGTSG
jgi:hypothetical protein